MNKVIAILSPVALSLALVTLPVSAGKGHHQHRGLHSELKQLDLSEQQRQDIRQTFSQSRDDKAVYREDLRALRDELKGYIHTDSWNEAAVRELLSQQEHLLATTKLQKAQKRHTVWNLLTAEQQQQWQTLKQQKKARWDEAKAGKKRRSKLDKLDLSAEQQASIEQLRAAMQTQKQSFKAELESFKQGQQAIIQAENFDQQAWQQLWQQNQALLVNMAVTRAKFKHDMWNVFSAEQQQAFEQMQSKRKSRKKQRS